MASVTKPGPKPAATKSPFRTAGEVLKQLGGIPADRVRVFPVPGTATEIDLIKANDRKEGICELIDGTLIEKTADCRDSALTVALIAFLGTFIRENKLGRAFGPNGPSRLSPSQVRCPDVWFVTAARLRQCRDRKAEILEIAPDLAVEILNKSNSHGEMQRKLRDYFAAGTRLVWYVDPKKRTVRVYTDPDKATTLTEDQTLDGGDVLPGFSLCLRELFAELDD